MKKAGEDGFYTAANDALYYTSQTDTYLAQRKIKTITTTASLFKFNLKGQAPVLLNRQGPNYAWGLILFDGRHAPKEADLVEPAADVKAVFGK